MNKKNSPTSAANSDPLYPEEITTGLNTKFIGKRVIYYPEIDSTNNQALKLFKIEIENGSVIVADHQTTGRGRRHRIWLAPAGKALLFSIMITRAGDPVKFPFYTCIGALAVAEAIRSLYSLPVSVKWPNDVLINEKKVCGILTELANNKGKQQGVVVGIGINVNQTLEELKFSVLMPATSILIERKEFTPRGPLLREILRHFDAYYVYFLQGKTNEILRGWKGLSTLLGHPVKIVTTQGEITGLAIDIESDGALVVRQNTGFLTRILSGDVEKIDWKS